MKFFHLSDLHIGLKLMNQDLREDQEYILKQIASLAKREQPDAILIAGDIYDKSVPSAEAVEIFDHFMADLTEAVPAAAIMLISGNHDSAPRVNCFRSVLSRQRLYMIGNPPQQEYEHMEKVTLKDAYGKVNFYLLPFVKPSMVKAIVGTDENGNNLSYDATLRALIRREEIDENERNVLVSHQFYLPSGQDAVSVERMDSEVRTVGNIDAVSADMLNIFDYAALGHIHKPMKVGSDCLRYCGTPLACSVSEAGQEKQVLMVELSKKEESWQNWIHITGLPLHPLRQVRVVRGTLEDVLEKACEDYVTVILTDKELTPGPDIQDRIRMAFPYLLEIRREYMRSAVYEDAVKAEEILDPYALCCSFLNDPDEEEQEILRDVINQVLSEDSK